MDSRKEPEDDPSLRVEHAFYRLFLESTQWVVFSCLSYVLATVSKIFSVWNDYANVFIMINCCFEEL